jgi:biopolymer transport protein ExbB
MNITEQFLSFTLLGAEWVLWLLVLLSILSVGVMVERLLFFRARAIDAESLADAVSEALAGSDAGFAKRYREHPAMAAQVAVRGIGERKKGIDAVSEAMNSQKTRARSDYERYLIILGTLGNNAPFIGLFGTVLGIIKAFSDLAGNSEGGAEVVMAGISEALVATAVGLLVAIPAVVAFNYFNRRVRAAATVTDDIAHTILAELYGREHSKAKTKDEGESKAKAKGESKAKGAA